MTTEETIYQDYKYVESIAKFSHYCPVVEMYNHSNFKLQIETGRWNNIAKELRLCSFCNKEIGDEYHILFTCSNDRIVQLRQKHIPNYYWNPPVIFKMEGLFRLCNTQLMTNISRFIKNMSQSL
jgi:hypothetical protein